MTAFRRNRSADGRIVGKVGCTMGQYIRDVLTLMQPIMELGYKHYGTFLWVWECP
jgi:hypothetical protein